MSRTEREKAPVAFQLRSSLGEDASGIPRRPFHLPAPALTAGPRPRDPTAAERMRRYRSRRKSDEILASSVPLPRKVVEALTDAEIISDAETEDSRTLGEALGRHLVDLFHQGALVLKK